MLSANEHRIPLTLFAAPRRMPTMGIPTCRDAPPPSTRKQCADARCSGTPCGCQAAGRGVAPKKCQEERTQICKLIRSHQFNQRPTMSHVGAVHLCYCCTV